MSADKRQARNRASELDELKRDLADGKNDKKIEAIKKIIGNLNVGKDVSALFFPVIKCLSCDSIEIRKLVYLYVIHYSKERPGDSIMAINSLVKDATNKSNPLVRALAIRTMGCLRVKDLCNYLIDPLKKALEDSDAYVRKNAVMCVPKVYEIDQTIVDTQGLLQLMKNILEKDKNSVVVANTVTALSEINTLRPAATKIKILTKNNLENVLAALNETVEWGQVCILDYLAENPPKEAKNAEVILDRVLLRLNHINPAVVFSACKVIIAYFPLLDKDILVEGLCKKLAAPLGSLVTGDCYENIWAVLRGLQLVVVKYPQIFTDVKIFFVRYNDPSFVKHEKLSLIFNLTSEKNFESVLNELNEYAYDMDPEFNSQAVRCIWKTALKISMSLQKVLGMLSSVVASVGEGSGQHFIEEVMIGYEQIVRRYPKASNYAENVKQIMTRGDCVNKSDAKASLLFLLGEYYPNIEDGQALVTSYIENMAEEDLAVQLQILSTAVKIYIANPQEFLEQLSNLFKTASENTDNPDLRDRAFIYWRLLNLGDVEIAREIVMGEKPQTVDEENTGPVTPELAAKLIPQLGLITSILWETEQKLGIDVVEIGGTGDNADPAEQPAQPRKKEIIEQREIDQEDLLGLGLGPESPAQKPQSTSTPANPPVGGFNDNLLDIGIGDELVQTPTSAHHTTSPATQNQGFGNLMDLTGGFSGGHSSGQWKNPPLEIILPRMQSGLSNKNGVEILAAVGKTVQGLQLHLQFKTMVPMMIGVGQIGFMPNSLGLGGMYQPGSCMIPPNGTQELFVPLSRQQGFGQAYTSMINLNVTTNYESYILGVPVYPHVLADTHQPVTTDEFKQGWMSGQQFQLDHPSVPLVVNNEEQLKALFRQNGITHLSTQSPGGSKKHYFGCRLETKEVALIELTNPSPTMIGALQILVKSSTPAIPKAFVHTIVALLR